jgi:hypothetical protein
MSVDCEERIYLTKEKMCAMLLFRRRNRVFAKAGMAGRRQEERLRRFAQSLRWRSDFFISIRRNPLKSLDSGK